MAGRWELAPHRPAAAAQELGRQRNASRSSPVTPVSSARAQAVRSPTRARMSSGIWVARTLERRRAVSAPAAPGGVGAAGAAAAARRFAVGSLESTSARP